MNIYSHLGIIEGVLFSLLALSISSCTADYSKNNRDGADLILPKESDLVRITDKIWRNNSYTVCADAKLNNKYHTVCLRIRDKSGNPINDKPLDFYPEMSMGRMKHGGPYENPLALRGIIHQIFRLPIVWLFYKYFFTE